jgi:hypothetical protein
LKSLSNWSAYLSFPPRVVRIIHSQRRGASVGDEKTRIKPIAANDCTLIKQSYSLSCC